MIYSTDIKLPDPYQGLNPWCTALTLSYLVWPYQGLNPWYTALTLSYLVWPYQGLNPWSTALTLCYLVWPYQGLTPWSTALTLSYLVWPYQGLNPWSTALTLCYLIPTRAWTHDLQHWHYVTWSLPGLEPMIYSTDIMLPDPYQGLNPWSTALTLCYLIPTRAWTHDLQHWHYVTLSLPGLEPMIYSTDIMLPCLTLPGLDPMIYSTDIKLPCLTLPGLEPMIYSADIKLPDPYQGLNPWSTALTLSYLVWPYQGLTPWYTALTLSYLIPTRAWTHNLQHWH